MKIINTQFFTLFVILFSSFLFGQKQEKLLDESFLKAVYRVSFLSDTLNVNSRKEEDMVLLIGKVSSLYFSEQKYLSDSLTQRQISNSIAAAKSGNGVINVDLKNIPKYYSTHEVYKKEGMLIFNKLDKNYFSFSPANEIQWKLEKGAIEIMGYLCYKATGIYNGRLYEAWYSPEVHVSDGPYVFKALPGLVFKVTDGNAYNTFDLVGLEKVSQLIKPISKSESTTRQKFRAARQAYIDTTSDRLKGYIYRELTADELKKIESVRRSAPNNYLD
ncbi:GLPGLI family protein [Soonwooa sp.]|uniref:GLPGLI family protein n=1 Tax=Soonwooa sp. TaxID=1938592 RepID=UPI002624B8A2|nr:GLPGLI family protein [Soonwooa sp.]